MPAMDSDLETLDPHLLERSEPAPSHALRLTIMSHPEPARIGRFVDLPPRPGGVPVSRLDPSFDDGRPLDDPFVSRKPLVIGRVLDVTGTSTAVALNGRPVSGSAALDADTLALGAVLQLGEQVTLLLQRRPVIDVHAGFGLVGGSPGLDRVRQEIRLVADLDVPVLIRGPSGAGKELVARALHQASRRRDRRWVAVNMAAVQPELAASTLFGHARGAFSGAVSDHDGHFVRADGGSLFLDEVGDTPTDVQAMLLRVLETREVQPVGGRRAAPVDVRLISATDADLDDAERFRAPLLHRLAGFQVHVPPLAERRADVGPLFAHFARAELASMGLEGRWAGDPRKPWLPASLMTALLLHGWPGNVRQLRNVTRQLVILHRDADRLKRWREILPRLLGPSINAAPAPAEQAPVEQAPTPRKRYRHVDDVGDDELVAALEHNRFEIKAAAEQLGVSRTALYGRVDRCERVRKAADLSAEQIEAAGRSHPALEPLATALGVSLQALKRRMKQLGLR